MVPKKKYNVRTLYFDDFQDSAYYEKQAGVYRRKKYRLRIYNHSDSTIKFECKSKISSYILKETTLLKRREADCLVAGEYSFLEKSDDHLLREFYLETRCKLLRPVVIVEYEREAYIHPIGKVRITFDSCLSVGMDTSAFFEENTYMTTALEQKNIVLEVKYNEVLPEYIRGIFPDTIRPRLAIGKFVICRNQQMTRRGIH